MTTRQRLHQLVDELTDAEVDDLTQIIVARRTGDLEPEMAELPAAWRTLDDGSPAPNWVALVDEVRSER